MPFYTSTYILLKCDYKYDILVKKTNKMSYTG